MRQSLEALSSQAVAILLALLLGAIVVLSIGESPVRVLVTLLEGAFGNQERIAGTLLQATPILVCGVAACISLRAGLFKRGLALLKVCVLFSQGGALEVLRAPHRLGRLKLSLLGLALRHGPELLARLHHSQRWSIDWRA